MARDKHRLTGPVIGLLMACTAFLAYFAWRALPFWLASPRPAGYDKLMAAIHARDVRSVNALLDSGINPNAFPHDNSATGAASDVAPIDAAATLGSVPVVQALLSHGASPNIGDVWDANPLEAAGYGEHLDAMDLLLKHGAKANDLDTGSTALWDLALDGKVEAVNFLLAHGANPNTAVGGEKLLHALSVMPTRRDFEQIEAALRKAGAKL